MYRSVKDFNRLGREAWYGAVSTFSPGFSSGSLYKQIPLPTDQLPYVLTHFVNGELTWEPGLSEQAMRARIAQRFFGQEATTELSSGIWDLRELIRVASAGVWGINSAKRWAYLGCKGMPADVKARIEELE
jgi:hypothetical protein